MTLTPLTLFSISPWIIVMIVILVILIGAIIFLTIWGKKQQKKMDENQAQIEANSQNMTMLIIDKKKMKLKDAGLPAVVLENTPKYLRRSKVPVVKAKVGPKVMTLMCDAKVFEVLPVKKEAKVVVSGIYITGIKSVRGGLDIPEKKKKKRFFSKKEK